MNNLIGRGAEASIFLDGDVVKKIRSPKLYRIDEIDTMLRKKRTRAESRILNKIGDIGPGFLGGDDVSELRMNHLNGPLVKNVLNDNINLSKNIGKRVSSLHDLNVIHSDLTTSNMILSNNNDLKIIDFGLSFISDKVEDKAVDLHLFKEAVRSKHFAFEEDIWHLFLEGYNPKNKDEILNRLDVVELRGRNKQKY